MALWNDITKKASILGEKAVKQAKDLSETAKLHLQLSEAEKNAANSYAQLGRLYAAAHPEDCEEGLRDAMAAAINAEKAVADLHQQLRDAKGTVLCEKCGAEIAKDSAFCHACGAEIPKPAPVDAEIVILEPIAEASDFAE